ncbi:hypothetical protein [Tropicimonas sp.]|uniref:hypothetical protein n=1 Tax=Tropicimonas sp. TaxID=2067044 RepID=UPI003A877521
MNIPDELAAKLFDITRLLHHGDRSFPHLGQNRRKLLRAVGFSLADLADDIGELFRAAPIEFHCLVEKQTGTVPVKFGLQAVIHLLNLLFLMPPHEQMKKHRDLCDPVLAHFFQLDLFLLWTVRRVKRTLPARRAQRTPGY